MEEVRREGSRVSLLAQAGEMRREGSRENLLTQAGEMRREGSRENLLAQGGRKEGGQQGKPAGARREGGVRVILF